MPEPSITTPFLITRSYAIARSSRPGPRGHARRRILLRWSGGRAAGTHRGWRAAGPGRRSLARSLPAVEEGREAGTRGGWRAVGTGRLRLARSHRDVEEGREAGTHRGWRAVGTGRLRLAKSHRDVETRLRLPRDNLDLESLRPCARMDLLTRRRGRRRRWR